MGRDGAQGLLQRRGLGWRTIAQDESSSVVWGMPRAAIEIGAAEEVSHLDRIAEAIARLVPK
jgi:chemotaxis response regulator CheB